MYVTVMSFILIFINKKIKVLKYDRCSHVNEPPYLETKTRREDFTC